MNWCDTIWPPPITAKPFCHTYPAERFTVCRGARRGILPDRFAPALVRLENLFDEDYTTIHARGFPDSATGASFVVHNLGVPRTLHVSYGFSF